jgi:hypothetical protein
MGVVHVDPRLRDLQWAAAAVPDGEIVVVATAGQVTVDVPVGCTGWFSVGERARPGPPELGDVGRPGGGHRPTAAARRPPEQFNDVQSTVP